MNERNFHRESAALRDARAEVDRTRARLLGTIRSLEITMLEIKNQLTPSHILGDAWVAAKSKGADLAEDAVDAVRARPIAATGIIAAITMFLAREPLIDLAGRLMTDAGSKRRIQKSAKAKAKAKQNDTENAQ